jgi:hypothetical protein
MLAGTNPEKLKEAFLHFFSSNNAPHDVTLWRWKKSYWICAPEKFRQEILVSFVGYGIIEFSSAPPPTDIEFIGGDASSVVSLL